MKVCYFVLLSFFEVFNATNNFKATSTIHWFLAFNESFTKLNSRDKNLFLTCFTENILIPNLLSVEVRGSIVYE